MSCHSQSINSPVRVTLISRACVVGVYQTKLEALAAHDDVQLTVVVPPYWHEGGRVVPLERRYTRGYELVVAPLAFNGRFHTHFFPTLPRILRRTKPDLVHMDEEPYNLATWLTLQSARRLGARTVFFTWQNLLRRYPPPFRWMERHVYRTASGAIAGNAEAVEVLRQKGFQGPVLVTPQFGVDANLFVPGGAPRQSGFTVGYAGRLVEEKGLPTLVDALAELQGEWRLLVSGTGPLRPWLEEQLKALGYGERVRFLGQVPTDQMPGVYQQMDVLVLPSRTRPNWKEQFGRVLIEAMACGVPVVGSDSGEIPHVIGEAGLVFPEGDVAALRECLRRMRSEVGLRRELGRRGRQRVIDHYTQGRVAAETAAFYRAILAD